jgi:hypothetical protein
MLYWDHVVGSVILVDEISDVLVDVSEERTILWLVGFDVAFFTNVL